MPVPDSFQRPDNEKTGPDAAYSNAILAMSYLQACDESCTEGAAGQAYLKCKMICCSSRQLHGNLTFVSLSQCHMMRAKQHSISSVCTMGCCTQSCNTFQCRQMHAPCLAAPISQSPHNQRLWIQQKIPVSQWSSIRPASLHALKATM